MLARLPRQVVLGCDLRSDEKVDGEEVLGKPEALTLKHTSTEGSGGGGTGEAQLEAKKEVCPNRLICCPKGFIYSIESK